MIQSPRKIKSKVMVTRRNPRTFQSLKVKIRLMNKKNPKIRRKMPISKIKEVKNRKRLRSIRIRKKLKKRLKVKNMVKTNRKKQKSKKRMAKIKMR